ncbi:MAG: replication protein [Lachnospiraceae bacterium]|nr:replication protein [Lachnospiraceae bacterium]
MDIQSRKWQLTINNPQHKQLTHEEIKYILNMFKSIQYYCLSDEIAGTHHTHIYLLFKSPVRFTTIKNKFPQAHIEKAYGTSAQNREYVFKEGKWEQDKKKETNLAETHEEWGDLPEERQGARNDCAELYEMVTEGKSNYEIIEGNPNFIKQVERIDKVRQIVQEEQFKEIFRNLEVEYIFGDTGSGKTRCVMEKYGYSNVYRVTNYKNPFDQYQGQDVIAFEEFQSSIPINQMLVYLDGYPLMLPCRYSDKVACYTKAFILSNIDLKEQYQDIQRYNPETWKAFLRRIQKVRVFQNGKTDEYRLYDYLYEFQMLTAEQLKLCPFYEG